MKNVFLCFKGTAEVVFYRRLDAETAIKRFNNVQLDGLPMRIEIVGTSLPVAPLLPTPLLHPASHNRYRNNMSASVLLSCSQNMLSISPSLTNNFAQMTRKNWSASMLSSLKLNVSQSFFISSFIFQRDSHDIGNFHVIQDPLLVSYRNYVQC